MDAILGFLGSWPGLISMAFSEHSLAATALTVVAVGIFVRLQRDLRPYTLVSNLAFVAVGWLVALSLVVPAISALRGAWSAIRESSPFAASLLSYLYGIGERHPLMALIIVAAGTGAYFLRSLWPYEIGSAPLRALCALFGIALALHIAGPIADLADGAPPRPVARERAQALPQLPAREAVARAVKAGDTRYLSVQRCVDEVAGLPAREGGERGVKSIGPSCRDSLGKDAAEHARRLQAYASEYNRLMHEHKTGVSLSLKGG